MNASNIIDTPRSELSDGLNRMVNEADLLLKKASETTGQEYESTLRKAEAQLRKAKSEFIRLEEAALLNAKYAARATDRAVHEHPYTAMGLAAGIGLLLGLLITHR